MITSGCKDDLWMVQGVNEALTKDQMIGRILDLDQPKATRTRIEPARAETGPVFALGAGVAWVGLAGTFQESGMQPIRWIRAPLALALLALTACPAIERPAPPRPECTLSSECPAGKVCGVGGACVDECRLDRDCPAPLVCEANVCAPQPGRCVVSGQCASGQVCGAGGACTTACAQASDCGAGQACIGGGCLTATAPAPECLRNSDCPVGKVCAASGVCAAACALDRDCALPLVCSDASCVPPSGRCLVDTHCATDQVCAANATCSDKCDTPTACGSGGACISGACAALLAPPPQCLRNSDCPASQACVGGACAAACTADRDCSPGAECQSGACVLSAPDCVRNSDCVTDQACIAGSCGVACLTSRDCPVGAVCGGSGACVVPAPQCVRNSDCSSDRACVGGACALACVADRDCATGAQCGAGACVLSAPECERNSDCAADKACVGGGCAVACLDNRDCPVGALCNTSGACVVPAPQCVRNSDCASDQACLGGSCAAACVNSRDCAPGSLCSAGTCVVSPPQCLRNSDCPVTQACVGGACTLACIADRDCATGAVCSTGACVLATPQCTRNSDCVIGNACVAGSCAVACLDNRDCPVGALCNGSGACVVPAPQCVRDSDCASDQACVAGSCADACVTSRDCPPGSVCSAGACAISPPECVRNSDCPLNQACLGGDCALACVQDRDCAAGAACNTGACVVPAAQCERNSDCPADKACVAGSCAVACVDNRDCPVGALCNASGACVVPAPECARNSDCASDQSCVAGECADACVTSRDCPPGSLCSDAKCVVLGAECVSAADCAQSGVTCSAAGLCVTVCSTTGDCGSGEVCSNGGCVESGPSTAAIQGVADLFGLADDSGIGVKLRGPGNADLVTGPSGAWSFAGLPPGRYQVTLAAPSTAEGSVARDLLAAAGATTDAGTTHFTPVGSVSGTATLRSTPAPGIQVFAAGTALGAQTGTDGRFTVRGLPLGTHRLVATYPGFDAAEATDVVQYGQTTALPAALRLEPAGGGSSGAVFAFFTEPPTNVRAGQPYLYTAGAGGAGITAPVYSLAAGPLAMSIDPDSGSVTYTPDGADVGNWIVAIAAAGGGYTVYQVYKLFVNGPYDVVVPDAADGLDVAGGVTWATHAQSVSRTAAGATQIFTSDASAYAGAIDSMKVVNGGRLLGVSYPGGTITDVRAPIGPFAATWAPHPGGEVKDWKPENTITVGSQLWEGGIVASVSVESTEMIVSARVHTGAATSFAPGFETPTRVFVHTNIVNTGTGSGLVTALVGTDTISDASATWTTNTLGAKCVTDDAGTAAFDIIGTGVNLNPNTPTTLKICTTSCLANTTPVSFLPAVFQPGDRYFIITCPTAGTVPPYLANFAIEDTDTAPLINLSTGYRVDLYGATAPLANYQLATLAGLNPTTMLLGFLAPVTMFSSLTNPDLRHVIGFNTGFTGLPLTGIFDSSGNLPPNLASMIIGIYVTNFGSGASQMTILRNTPTSITFRSGVPYGKLLELDLFYAPGQTWWLATTAPNDMLVTLYGQSGRFTPGEFGINSLFLYLEDTGKRYQIKGNSENAFRVLINAADLPPWPPTMAAVVGSSSGTPNFHVDTSSSYKAADWSPSRKFLDPQGGTYREHGTITFSDDAGADVDGRLCNASNPCPGEIAARLAMAGRRFITSDVRGGVNHGRHWINVSAPVLVPGELGNVPFAPLQPTRRIAPLSAPHLAGEVLWNGTDFMQVAVPAASFAAFDALTGGDELLVTEPSGAFRIRVGDAHGAGFFIPGEWTDHRMVDVTGQVVGTVLDNDAESLEVAVPYGTSLEFLETGAPYGLGALSAGGCALGKPSLEATVTLGASLSPGAYDTVTIDLSPDLAFQVASNDPSEALIWVCPDQFDDFLDAMGAPAAFSAGGEVPVVIEDSDASFGAESGKQVIMLDGFSLGRVASNTGTGLNLTMTPSQWFNAIDSVAPGARFAFVDNAAWNVPATFRTDRSFTPGELAGRFVWLVKPIGSNSYGTFPFLVDANGASDLTGTLSYVYLGEMPPALGGYDTVITTGGVVVRLVDTRRSFPPGALVGRKVYLDTFRELEIVANTEHEILAAGGDDFTLIADIRGALTYSVPGIEADGPVLATAQGEALVGMSNGVASVWRMGPAGRVAEYNRLTTGRKLRVTPAPNIRGVIAAYRDTGDAFEIDVAGSPFAGLTLAGGRVLVASSSMTSWSPFTITDNDEDTVVFWGNPGSVAGRTFVVDPFRLEVQGAPLVPGELVGETLRANGVDHVVRWNTDTEIQLVDPNWFDENTPVVDVAGGDVFVLDGLLGDRVLDLVSDGASGFYVGTDQALARFDGLRWKRLRERETATLLGAGMVAGTLDSNTLSVTPAAGAYAPQSLVGFRVLTSVGMFRVTANNATTLDVSPSFSDRPIPGESYTLYKSDGLDADNFEFFSGSPDPIDTPVYSISLADGVLWAGTNRGLYRYDGALWSRFTVASTESAPGEADRLMSDYIDSVAGESATSVWVGSTGLGAARFDYATGAWTRYTAATTGVLPSDEVHDIHFTPGGVWFGTEAGAARLSGTTWTPYGFAQGFAGPGGSWLSVHDLLVEPGGTVLAATNAGVVRFTP